MRPFAMLGVLLIVGGVFLLVQGGLHASRCISSDVMSFAVWRTDFWLRPHAESGAALAPNAHWLIRLIGGLISAGVGTKILRVATR